MPESTPNYLTLDAQGRVGALFPGGLQMIHSPTTPPTDANEIKWITDPVTKAVRAEIYSATGASRSALTLASQQTSGAASVSIEQNTGPDTSAVRYSTFISGIGTRGGTIIDNTGVSSFVQNPFDIYSRISLYGPYNTGGFTIPASTGLLVGPIGVTTAAFSAGTFFLMGFVNGSNTVSWGYYTNTTNTITFTAGNWYTVGTPTVSISFMILRLA